MKRRDIKIILSILFSFLLIVLLRTHFTLKQSITMGGLMLVILWWATNLVNRVYSSIALLLIFMIFGNTPVQQVFYFPLSKSFVLVLSSLLLAEVINKSGIASIIADNLINKWVKKPKHLVTIAFIVGIILIFIIPHPYPRVIILSVIFNSYLNKNKVKNSSKQYFLFAVFVAGTVAPLLFLNGDFVLSYAMFDFAQVSLTWSEWAGLMTLPSLITMLVCYYLYLVVFKKQLSEVKFTCNKKSNDFMLTAKQKKTGLLMMVIMIMWATEFIHKLDTSLIAVLGVLVMFFLGLLKIEDLKKIKIELLLNLTAVFSIGKVLKYSGISNVLQTIILNNLSISGPNQIIFIVIITVMLIHLTLGSCLTTMSITIPILVTLFSGTINPLVIALTSLIVVSIHYLLPYHHLTLVVGSADNLFSNKVIIKYGLFMTVLVFGVIYLVYLPWWKLLNLL